MFGLKRKRRERIRSRPFPPEWLAILERNVPYFSLLPDEDREELKGHIQVFLEEKCFEGASGLEVTDEIRVTIAAYACVLLLHRKTNYYPTLKTVVVYPHQFFVRETQLNPDGTVSEEAEARSGESWYRGEVILSWDDVKRGASDARDGHNVVLHEFAHQLDGESGEHDGAPLLERRSMYTTWARVLGEEYRKLSRDIEHHRKTFLDQYASTDPAEFFAVVTEAFFEQPQKLRRRHPELYKQMSLFYRQDPAGYTS